MVNIYGKIFCVIQFSMFVMSNVIGGRYKICDEHCNYKSISVVGIGCPRWVISVAAKLRREETLQFTSRFDLIWTTLWRAGNHGRSVFSSSMSEHFGLYFLPRFVNQMLTTKKLTVPPSSLFLGQQCVCKRLTKMDTSIWSPKSCFFNTHVPLCKF